MRPLWIVAFITCSIWFSYWICYDVFVWNKLFSQVNPQNYFGLVLSIVLIIVGTQLGKTGISETSILRIESAPRKAIKKNQVQQIKELDERELIQPNEQIQWILPLQEEETRIPKDSKVPPGCKFYLGYLHKRPKKSLGIPKECLECGQVVNCISPTVHTIEERPVNPQGFTL